MVLAPMEVWECLLFGVPPVGSVAMTMLVWQVRYVVYSHRAVRNRLAMVSFAW